MDCYFRQYWRDSRLSFLGPIKNLSLSIKMLERIWRPDTYFYNGKNSYVHTITVPNKLLRITQEGDILYSMRSVTSISRGQMFICCSCKTIANYVNFTLHAVINYTVIHDKQYYK